MKSLDICRIVINLVVLLCTSLLARTQPADYPVSDTLMAGDTTIVIVHADSHHTGPEEPRAEFTPRNYFVPESCPVCNTDTVRSFKSELYEDSTYYFYFDVPLGTMPGEYDLASYYEDGYSGYSLLPKWIISRPVIYLHPGNKIACPGDTTLFKVELIGSEYLSYQWFRNGIELDVPNDYTLEIENVQENDTGMYYCIASNYWGSDTSELARLELVQAPGNPGLPIGLDRFCLGTEATVYTISTDPYATDYVWKLTPEDAGRIDPHDTTASIFWDANYNGTAELNVSLQNELCEAVLSDTLGILISGPSSPPPICIVGIDKGSGKYRIVWDKPGIEAIQLFKIYRESNLSDIYLEIGTLLPDEFSVFVDSASAPNVLPHRYKIGIVDTCGNESEMSAYHQTMHLSANMSISNDVNLIWSGYMGIPFQAYDIYRGIHPDSMTLLMQVPSTVTSFTDEEPPLGIIYYQVGLSNPAGCLPTKKSDTDYSSSKSNMEQVKNALGIVAIEENNLFTIYPNPVRTDLNIQFKTKFVAPVKYEIYNPIGLLLIEGMIQSKTYRLNVSSLPAGIFILKLSNETGSYTARFMTLKND